MTHTRTTTACWPIAARAPISFAQRPLLAGILNCTPDSFSDGGKFATTDHAIAHGLRLINEGADILDVGGESTRPGAQRVSATDQIRRIEPVIRSLRQQSNIPISVDTTLSLVAQSAIAAGANIVNDVSGGEEDENIFSVAANTGAGLILMHRLRPPGQDEYSDQYQINPVYNDVVQDVLAHLLRLVERAHSFGVRKEHVVIDPGFGFGKSVNDNFALLRRLSEITQSQIPVLASLSRKSFLGAACGAKNPSERLPASLAAAALAKQGGVAILRVHDVLEHRQFLSISAACTAC